MAPTVQALNAAAAHRQCWSAARPKRALHTPLLHSFAEDVKDFRAADRAGKPPLAASQLPVFLHGSIMLKRLEEDGAADSGAGKPASAEPTSEGLPKKVLIAEDNVVSQQAAKRFLEAMGCDVMVVEDGAAAVNACARQEFGLVLMDLQMPRMDGIQATQEIRRQERAGRH